MELKISSAELKRRMMFLEELERVPESYLDDPHIRLNFYKCAWTDEKTVPIYRPDPQNGELEKVKTEILLPAILEAFKKYQDALREGAGVK